MTTFFLCTLFVLIPALLLFSAVIAFKRRMTGKSPKKALRFNVGVFAALICAVALTSVSVFAAPENEESADQAATAEAAQTAENNSDMSKGMAFLRPVSLRVLPVSAAVLPLRPVRLPPLPPPAKIPKASVNPSSSWHSANPSPCTVWLSPS